MGIQIQVTQHNLPTLQFQSLGGHPFYQCSFFPKINNASGRMGKHLVHSDSWPQCARLGDRICCIHVSDWSSLSSAPMEYDAITYRPQSYIRCACMQNTWLRYQCGCSERSEQLKDLLRDDPDDAEALLNSWYLVYTYAVCNAVSYSIRSCLLAQHRWTIFHNLEEMEGKARKHVYQSTPFQIQIARNAGIIV